MFFAISLLVTIVGQSIGLMVGAWFDVVVSQEFLIIPNENDLRKGGQSLMQSLCILRMAHFWHQQSPFR